MDNIIIIKTPEDKIIKIPVAHFDVNNGVLVVKTPDGKSYVTHISNALIITS